MSGKSLSFKFMLGLARHNCAKRKDHIVHSVVQVGYIQYNRPHIGISAGTVKFSDFPWMRVGCNSGTTVVNII